LDRVRGRPESAFGLYSLETSSGQDVARKQSQLSRETKMPIFDDAAAPDDFVPCLEDRLPPRVSLLIIVSLAVLSWELVGGIVMAVRAVL
jgi:hypothetical protein